jgi:hypothetical protein
MRPGNNRQGKVPSKYVPVDDLSSGLADFLRDVESMEDELDEDIGAFGGEIDEDAILSSVSDSEKTDLYAQMDLEDVGNFRSNFENKVRSLRATQKQLVNTAIRLDGAGGTVDALVSPSERAAASAAHRQRVLEARWKPPKEAKWKTIDSPVSRHQASSNRGHLPLSPAAERIRVRRERLKAAMQEQEMAKVATQIVIIAANKAYMANSPAAVSSVAAVPSSAGTPFVASASFMSRPSSSSTTSSSRLIHMVADSNTSERMRQRRGQVEAAAVQRRIEVAPKADAVDVEKSRWVQRYRQQRGAEANATREVGATKRGDATRRLRRGLATAQEQQQYREMVDSHAEEEATASIDELLGGGIKTTKAMHSATLSGCDLYGHAQQRARRASGRMDVSGGAARGGRGKVHGRATVTREGIGKSGTAARGTNRGGSRYSPVQGMRAEARGRKGGV